MAKPAVLIISGLDPQGCAGITADIQAVTTQECHPVPLLTCLTEQTSSGLTHIRAIEKAQFMAHYQCCTTDFDIAAIKIGLIPNIEIAQCITTIITENQVPIILDPILGSTSGGKQTDETLLDYIKTHLLPAVTVLTPNAIELESITKQRTNHYTEREQAAKTILTYGTETCLVSGGHNDSTWAADYLINSDTAFYCYHPKKTGNVRGTGCILSSVIACQLAHGQDVRDAVVLAKSYLNNGIRRASTLGSYTVFQHHYSPLELDDIPKLVYDFKFIGQQFDFPDCPQQLGIYPVVDSSEWVNKLLDENITTIQLRIKDQNAQIIKAEICKTVDYCNDSIACFINDHWQAAIEAGAYGIHLGQEDLHDANLTAIEQAGLRLGISTHSYWELARALAINPSYIAFGPIFATDSKQMPFQPQGIERLQQWISLLTDAYPLVAIGGINLQRAEILKSTDVGSIAMISAITKAEDYKAATQAFLTSWSA